MVVPGLRWGYVRFEAKNQFSQKRKKQTRCMYNNLKLKGFKRAVRIGQLFTNDQKVSRRVLFPYLRTSRRNQPIRMEEKGKINGSKWLNGFE